MVIPVSPAPSRHRPDVPVDRLDFAERDLLVALVENALEVAREQLAELAEGRQPLPTQGLEAWSQRVRNRRATPSYVKVQS